MTNPQRLIKAITSFITQEPESADELPGVPAEVYIISILEGIAIFILCAWVLSGFTDHSRTSLTV